MRKLIIGTIAACSLAVPAVASAHYPDGSWVTSFAVNHGSCGGGAYYCWTYPDYTDSYIVAPHVLRGRVYYTEMGPYGYSRQCHESWDVDHNYSVTYIGKFC